MTWLVICLVDSDREFESLSEVQLKSYSSPIKLSSESTPEFLLTPVGQDNIDYYEIYPSCNLDVTSTNVGEMITYTIVVSGCEEETRLWLSDQAWKNGERLKSTHYLTIEENKDSMLGGVRTVSFNRSQLTNDNVKLKLSYYLDVMPKDPLSPWPRYRWSYNIIWDVLDCYNGYLEVVLSKQIMKVWCMLIQGFNCSKYSQCTLIRFYPLKS